jgi:sugar O-acyltransferase (sialic acid O-acetyltransferase NeuD family)
MVTNKIILQGGGEHARVVLDCLLAANAMVLGIFDPKYTGDLFGVAQRGIYNPEFEPHARAIVAIGDNEVRKSVVSKTTHTFTNAIHPSVIISPFANFGTGNMFLHRVTIQAQASIGNHVILNTGTIVDHDCTVGDFAHLAPGVILCGTVKVGEGAFIGAGATVIPGKKIGAWSVIGAGSVVIDDIPDYALAVGKPARVIKNLKS